MAKATARCTCSVCGKEFIKTETKRNRREADDWEHWAKSAYTLCGSCWYKQQKEEEKAAGLKAEVRLGNLYNEPDAVWFVLYGDTYPIKDQLKEIGAMWTSDYPNSGDSFAGGIFGGLLGREPEKRWAIYQEITNDEELTETVDKLAALEFEISKFPSDEEMTMRRIARAQLEDRRKQQEEEKAAKEAEKQAKIKAEIGEIPQWPEGFPPVPGKWNGRFYGGKCHKAVYVDGVKYDLSDELAEVAEKVQGERAEWREKKAKLEKEK